MKISDRIIDMGRSLVAELEAESEGYRALRDGDLSKALYVEFLVQHHKYARVTYEMLREYSRTMGESVKHAYNTTISKGAARHAEEERGHDDGILGDLSILWGCTPEDALRRIEATPSAPAVDLYLASVRTALQKFPSAIAGLAAVLECVGESVARTARDNLLAVEPFPECTRANRWLSDHCEDGDHVEGGRLRIDLLEGVVDTSAVQALAAVTAVHYREVWRYMDALHAGELRARVLASV